MSKLSTWTHCTKFYENDPAELIHLFEMYFQACGFEEGENIAILSWTVAAAAAQRENIHESWPWLQDLGMNCFLQILCWWRLSNYSRSVLFAAAYEHVPRPRAHLQHKGKMLAALSLPLHHTWYSLKWTNPESHTQFRILMSKMMYQMIIMRQIIIL